ncbi:MAG TPA: RNA polymerase sigma-70 factor [Bacteroidales bacterium]|nr:RNA polymerase sigma-70 factor [Bacteroidales bacterium]
MHNDDKYTDQFLGTQIRSGNIEAFEVIYHKYKMRLYYYARHYLNDPGEVEEIVQNTFISLWEHRTDIDENKSVKNLLFRMTVNQVFNVLKHQVVLKEYAETYLLDNAEEDNSTQKEIYFNDLKVYVDRIVDTLPSQQQRVFKMSRWQGLPNDEIARSLGISVRTAENLLYRATRYIRQNLADEKMLVSFILCFSIF